MGENTASSGKTKGPGFVIHITPHLLTLPPSEDRPEDALPIQGPTAPPLPPSTFVAIPTTTLPTPPTLPAVPQCRHPRRRCQFVGLGRLNIGRHIAVACECCWMIRRSGYPVCGNRCWPVSEKAVEGLGLRWSGVGARHPKVGQGGRPYFGAARGAGRNLRALSIPAGIGLPWRVKR